VKLEYAQNFVNYDHLIGVSVRGHNLTFIGEIVSIEYAIDRWGHHNAIAVLDTGRRISCRSFGRKK
jgi:hypothetical protein